MSLKKKKKKLREELTKALLEATTSTDDGDIDGLRSNSGPASFKDLVEDVTLHRQVDIKAFAFKTKTIVSW